MNGVAAPLTCKVCGGPLCWRGTAEKVAGTLHVARFVCRPCRAVWELTCTFRRVVGE